MRSMFALYARLLAIVLLTTLAFAYPKYQCRGLSKDAAATTFVESYTDEGFVAKQWRLAVRRRRELRGMNEADVRTLRSWLADTTRRDLTYVVLIAGASGEPRLEPDLGRLRQSLGATQQMQQDACSWALAEISGDPRELQDLEQGAVSMLNRGLSHAQHGRAWRCYKLLLFSGCPGSQQTLQRVNAKIKPDGALSALAGLYTDYREAFMKRSE